jgi:predicted alpha/beta hydrolase
MPPAAQTAAMPPEALTLRCADGYPLAATLFRAAAPHASVVIAPALGVPRRFYGAYATFLAQQGFSALTFDYRGSGDSAEGPLRGRELRMADWGQLDIDTALAWARRELAPGKHFLVGHSAGAQLPGLAPASETLSGMILVAGSAPHLRHYPLRAWPMLALTWYLLGPLLAIGRDDFPARRTGLGSTRVAAGVVAQWTRWARSRDYLFDAAHRLDTQRYARLTLPLLSYAFDDDDYAPPAAVEALLRQYPAARIERRQVPRPARGAIGHFGFFREACADTLWRESADWLRRQLEAGAKHARLA